jgi:hypothetical protein
VSPLYGRKMMVSQAATAVAGLPVTVDYHFPPLRSKTQHFLHIILVNVIRGDNEVWVVGIRDLKYNRPK